MFIVNGVSRRYVHDGACPQLAVVFGTRILGYFGGWELIIGSRLPGQVLRDIWSQILSYLFLFLLFMK